MTQTGASLEEARRTYARSLAQRSGSTDPRVERAFAMVPREDFLPPGPWRILRGRRYVRTPDANPVHLYRNVLVALDAARGINNGEPLLHAAWIAAVVPAPGETVTQIGVGMGYYTAILALLVGDGGSVTGFELDAELARAARRNLAAFAGVTVIAGDASTAPLPPSDIVYVNAGVAAPPAAWLAALKPGGRMIFPWRPASDIGLAVLIVRHADGFAARAVMPSWFIPCAGASDATRTLAPPASSQGAWRIASLWLMRDRPPDATAVAVYPDLWFSSQALQ
ncbi:Protein-L-isoaspartate O-methyltransferase [bacterium YEK0313]|nr:Protein-L-isoaspartate O-methyltransferase [bacterium YEK0313]